MTSRLGARLSAVAVVDQLHGYAFVVLGVEIARRLRIAPTTLAAIGVVHGAAFVAVAGSVGARVRNGGAARVAGLGALSRAVALGVGAIPAIGAVAAALGLHGAARASVPTAHTQLLAPDQRDRHRLKARLGNVGAPLLVGLLALSLGWPAVFVALAVVSVAVALGGRPPASAPQHGPDATDAVLERFVAAPGGRLVMTTIGVAALAEFPIHVVAFAHLGRLGMPVWGRALLAAGAELVGVVANLFVSRRARTSAPRSPQWLAAAVFLSTVSGLVLLVTAVWTDALLPAVAALCIGAVGISAVIPFLALGTRAVLAGTVRPSVPIAFAIALAGAVALSGSETGAIAVLCVLPVVATVVTVGMAMRWPSSVAVVLDGVANVTLEPRISPAPAALDQA